MSSLYKLNEDRRKIADMLYEENIDEQMILDTLESIEGEIEDKADDYATIIKELLGDAKICKEEKQRLDERQKVFENRAKLLQNRLYEVLRESGKIKFKTPKFSFSICQNGGLQKLTIDGNVPSEYTKTIIENDTDKIRQALEDGKELSFAHLEPRGESLRIR